MASTPIQLRVDRDEMSLDDLQTAVAAFAGLLEELDTATSSTGRRGLDFRVATVSYHSPLLVEAMAEPREDAPDNGPAVVTLAIRGTQAVQLGAGRPEGFSDEALDHLRRLAGFSNGRAAVEIAAPTLRLVASVTSALAAQVDRVLSQGEAIGAIEGHLDTVSVHLRPFFTLYDALTGRGVKCYFADDRRAEVIASLGKRMLVHGRLRRDPGGAPREMRDIDNLIELGHPGGSPEGLAGVLRGLDVHALLREVRG
jgi:hypothetical protein